jgi:hypothetical protein
MIGLRGASVLILANVIVVSVLGVVAGGLTCLVLRRRWGPKAALVDAAIAADVAIVLMFLGSVVPDLFVNLLRTSPGDADLSRRYRKRRGPVLDTNPYVG